MRLNELIRQLQALKTKEFVETSRKGPTGIGHLLEKELGLNETNIAIPDIGGRVEMKGTRRNVNSLITLFTFNKAVWKVSLHFPRNSGHTERLGYNRTLKP